MLKTLKRYLSQGHHDDALIKDMARAYFRLKAEHEEKVKEVELLQGLNHTLLQHQASPTSQLEQSELQANILPHELEEGEDEMEKLREQLERESELNHELMTINTQLQDELQTLKSKLKSSEDYIIMQSEAHAAFRHKYGISSEPPPNPPSK